MKQRCWEHDYRAPSFYMITVVTEPRRACLSEVVDSGLVSGAAPAPELRLSPMGELVQDVWQRTNGIYAGVEACEYVVMPDHFHGILWVKEQQQRHMGHIVKAFKRVVEEECRSKGLLLPPNPSKGLRLPPNPSKGLRLPPNPSKGLRLPPNPSKGLHAAQESGAAAAPETDLWEEGYQDTILLRRGQLKRMVNYIQDNPRRLAVKRANPELFTEVAAHAVADGRTCPAIGNHFLLDHPVKCQVQVSRRISAEVLAEKKEELLYAAEHGAVLVSPCISPGEKDIARAAMDAGRPLIVLLASGFAPYYKPPGRYFDACAAGRLLMLAPFPYRARKHTITRQECLALNSWAEAVVSRGDPLG